MVIFSIYAIALTADLCTHLSPEFSLRIHLCPPPPRIHLCFRREIKSRIPFIKVTIAMVVSKRFIIEKTAHKRSRTLLPNNLFPFTLRALGRILSPFDFKTVHMMT